MINNVVLIGRLTRDVELHRTPQDQAVGYFTLAVNRNFKNQDGGYDADFINCVIWRKLAKNFASWIKKGNLVAITGHIQTRNYENQQGQRVYVTEVVIDSFRSLEKRDNSANRNSMDEQMPPSFESNQMNIPDDGLPF